MRDGLSVGKNLTEVLRSEDVSQRRSCQKAGGPIGVLDIRYRCCGIVHAIVDHGIDCDSHGVLSENLKNVMRILKRCILIYNALIVNILLRDKNYDRKCFSLLISSFHNYVFGVGLKRSKTSIEL